MQQKMTAETISNKGASTAVILGKMKVVLLVGELYTRLGETL